MKKEKATTKEQEKTLFGKYFGQVAWVVPDIEESAKYFQETMGVPHFMKMENLRSQDLEGTYNGQPADFEFHLYLAMSGGTMLELIQPVSGKSIFTDFLAQQKNGGIQHIAYMVQAPEFDDAVAQLEKKGVTEIQRLILPVAKVAFFDTYTDIGVATEIIGLTEAGNQLLEQLNTGNY
ncbi:VOC family protein [Lunatibacter salilacus]|uniref:VOC family protein n=1 Tax=Lunatibacter salilacus TaxID=2483804 RepID=UPI00131D9D4A|nr:VOC family protein [Lunatibacter salilacus]HSI78316.1 VOC family protein [Lunatimonas sp.]